MPDLSERLRARFADPAGFSWLATPPANSPQQQAAVLIAIEGAADDASILLTRRTDHLHHHPGQISFPGGRIEAQDASPQAAALRETREEVGLPAEALQILGTLPDFTTGTGFRIAPVVAQICLSWTETLDDFEVAELFRVPLSVVLDPSRYQRHRVATPAGWRYFHALPWQGRFIWGATAGMLTMFAAFVASTGENGGSDD